MTDEGRGFSTAFLRFRGKDNVTEMRSKVVETGRKWSKRDTRRLREEGNVRF
jgi:hypothetical protein